MDPHQRITGNTFLFKLKLLTVVCVLTSFCHYPPATFATAVSCPNEAMPQQSYVGANVSRNAVFLDLQHPITCNGTASGWKFCYYLPASENTDEAVESYSAVIGVWRVEDVFGTDRYVREMTHNINVPLGATGQSTQFLCETEYVDMSFDVHPGDVVGFYMRGDMSSRPLSLMSNMTTFASGDNKYVAQRATDGICVFSPTSALNPACLNNMAGLVMHVSLLVELFDNPYPEYFTTTGMEYATTDAPTMPESMTESKLINQRGTRPPATSAPPNNPTSGSKITDSENEPTHATTNKIISNRLPVSTTPHSSSSPSSPTRPPSPTSPSFPASSHPPSSPASLPTTELRHRDHTITEQSAGTTSSGKSGNSGQTGMGGQKNQGTSAEGRLAIFAAVPVVIVVSLIIVIVIVVLVVAMVKCRGRGLFKQRGERGHRHIGLDHFVIVSDIDSVPSGSILSSPVSSEPFPYEKVSSHSSGPTIIDNPDVSTPADLSNSVYGDGDDSKYRRISTDEAVYEALSENEEPCVPYLVPVGAVKMAKGGTIAGENAAKAKATKDVKDLYAKVNKKTKNKSSLGAESNQTRYEGVDDSTLANMKGLYAIVSKKKKGHTSSDNASDQQAHQDDAERSEEDGERRQNVKDLYAQVNKKKQSVPDPNFDVLLKDGKKYSQFYQHYLQEDMYDNGENSEERFMEPATNVQDLYAQVQNQNVKDIPEKDIKILEVLGSGQFGEVQKGVMTTPKGEVEVAVKTLVAINKSVSRLKLLQEAAIMGQFIHPNVIKLVGVATKREELMLVIEFASRGDLKTLLASMLPDPGELLAPESDKILLSFCHQLAYGMHYLSTKGFVHRDLAARNILVTQDCVLKIADFGMSRDLAEESYYISQGGKVPVKWTAPEAIHYKKYSTASDVWSYGCLLYEIWTLGCKPFNDCSNSEALDKLQSGYRLPPPPGCPRTIYSIMIDCWHPNTQARPEFKRILLDLVDREDIVLKVPKKDSQTHKLAGLVGGPLEAGANMYTDLQWKYSTYN